jgi:hypothetical protein
VSGASEYRVDVATTSDFTSGFVTGYNDQVVNGTSVSVIGLTDGTIYYVRVRARNTLTANIVTSTPSPSSEQVTLVGGPTNLTATAITTTSFTANWNSVTGASSYRLDVSTASDFATRLAGYDNLVVNGTSQSVTGLTAGTIYYVRARAVNAAGTSPNSATLTQITVPVAPNAPTISNVAARRFTATWNSVTGASEYRVDVATTSDFTSGISTDYNDQVVIGTSVSVLWLSPSTTYYIRVRARNTGATLPGLANIVTSANSVITTQITSREWRRVAMSSDGQRQTAITMPTGFANAQIYVSADFGNTWTVKDSQRDWFTVAMSSDGQRQTALVFDGRIYVSADFGNTWAVKGITNNWQAVDMSSNGQRQTAVAGTNQIYISTDYGNTWTEKIIQVTAGISLASVAISSDGRYQTVVGGNRPIYISSDFGNTWNSTFVTAGWSSVAMSSDGRYQTAVTSDGFGSKIYISSDFGINWSVADGSGTGSLVSVAMSSNGQRQTAVKLNGPIYISTDYGNNWDFIQSSPSREWEFIAMSSDGQRQIAIEYSGPMHISTDYGSTWVALIPENVL